MSTEHYFGVTPSATAPAAESMSFQARLERTVLNPLVHSSRSFYALLAVLLAVLAWGLYAYAVQLERGLVVIGTRDVVMWGVYIVDFIFFIGISYAGALVSAVLRLTHASWRTPVTRIAELIAVVALIIGAILPVIDLGRPERLMNLVWYGRFQSPLLWDIVAIMTYLLGSLIYFYLPLIPDFALMRDRVGQGSSRIRRQVLTWLAVGWQNLPEQRYRLEKAMGTMAVLIIPLAIAVHTVVAFIFSMTLRPGWNSTIYGIYFVIGAIFSGTAVLLVAMAILRRAYRLQEYITEKHFRYLGYLFLVLLLLYLYLTFTEYLTVGYKLAGDDKELLTLLMLGQDARWFWGFVVGGLVIPGFLVITSRRQTIPRIVAAGVLAAIFMWVKRFVIVVPSLQVPLMPFEPATYTPTWVEVSVTAGLAAAFTLIFVVLAKLVPVVSIWEVAHEQAREQQPIVIEEAKK